MLSRRRILGLVVALAASTPSTILAENRLTRLQSDKPGDALKIVVKVTSQEGKAPSEREISIAADTLEERAALLSSNPRVRVTATPDGTITIELDAVSDPEFAIATLSRRGYLEIVDTIGQFPEPGTFIRTSDNPSPNHDSTPVAGDLYETIVSSRHIERADPAAVGGGTPALSFVLNDEGAALLAEFTSQHIGEPLAIVIDSRVEIVPVIQAMISKEGIFASAEQADVDRLLIQLNVDPLLVDVELIDVVIAGEATPEP